ncbi:MAG: M16 family metallopeptidase [Planctomycetota bacterium]|jgi:predicted Zn-dependent peptidase
MSNLDSYTLKNGMVLLGERLDHVQSASFHFLLPAGAAILPEGCCGGSAIISDWLFRGAGDRNSRQLIETLDGLGIHRHAAVSANHLNISASLEAGNLPAALALFADIILHPQLDDKQFDLSRQLAVSELEGLDDDPRQKVMLHLAEQFYPDPYGRSPMGNLNDLKAMSAETVRNIIKQTFHPSQTVFSICGNYDFDAVCRQMEQLFDVNDPYEAPIIEPVHRGKSYVHYPSQGAQVHIGLMTAVPPISAPCYYELMTAVSILSGSMSSRLFTEVREKRGLCYAVGARYRSLKELGGISCYAGTTPEKAQETLDVTLEQFNLLKDGVTDDEMQRAKIGLKTSLIMQGESTSSRSGSIAGDYFLLGRVRGLDEIREKIEHLTANDVVNTLNENPFENFTVVTIGPTEIKI